MSMLKTVVHFVRIFGNMKSCSKPHSLNKQIILSFIMCFLVSLNFLTNLTTVTAAESTLFNANKSQMRASSPKFSTDNNIVFNENKDVTTPLSSSAEVFTPTTIITSQPQSVVKLPLPYQIYMNDNKPTKTMATSLTGTSTACGSIPFDLNYVGQTFSWSSTNNSANNKWKGNYTVTSDEGLVLTDVQLGDHYMAKKISILSINRGFSKSRKAGIMGQC